MYWLLATFKPQIWTFRFEIENLKSIQTEIAFRYDWKIKNFKQL